MLKKLHTIALITTLALLASATLGMAAPYTAPPGSNWNICSKNAKDDWVLHVRTTDPDHAMIELCTGVDYQNLDFRRGAPLMNCQAFADVDVNEFRRAQGKETLKARGLMVGDTALILAGVVGGIYGGYALFGVMTQGAGWWATALSLGKLGKVAVYTLFGYVGIKLGTTFAADAIHLGKTVGAKLNPEVNYDRADDLGSVVPSALDSRLGCSAFVNLSSFKKTTLKTLADATANHGAASISQDQSAPKQISAPQSPVPRAPAAVGSQSNAS